MLRVTALTSGKYDPPSRFRIRQFIDPLKGFGIDVSEYYPWLNKYATKRLPPLGLLMRLPGLLASRSSDVTWFSRELIPGKLTAERSAGGKRILDIDDAIWLNGSGFSEELAALCDGVIAGNNFIAGHYKAHGSRVWTIPTSVDTATWRPAPVQHAEWTIGWIGTSSNLEYLYSIEEALADFLADYSECRLLIVCNRSPVLKKLREQSWRFVRWRPENDLQLVQSMDVGLMPLPDTEWGRGKCALKMIQYMATGIPTIVSPVGVNKEILDQRHVGLGAGDTNDWYEALRTLFCDRELAIRLGKEGRNLVEEEFSIIRNAPKLATVIHEIAG
jgi:glycosyltransferase involved in cell wall biosynthesis